MPKKYLVENPDNSKLGLDQEIPNTAGKLLVTLHEVNGRTVGNIWVSQDSLAERLIDEHITDFKPDPISLMGELNRLALINGTEIDRNTGLKIAFTLLHQRVENLINGGGVETR